MPRRKFQSDDERRAAFAHMRRRGSRGGVGSRLARTSVGIPILTPSQKPEPLKNAPGSPFRFTGGKSRVRKEIIERMPPHSTYVEAFAGAGSVLLAKPPSEREIMNDKSKGIANVHQALVHAPHHEAVWPMNPNRERWERIKRKPEAERTPEEHAFYIEHSYGGMGRNYTHNAKKEIDIFELHKRLHDVKVENSDFAEVMKQWDTPTTLHYLDPPYVQSAGTYFRHDTVTPKQVEEVASKMKGKVMITYGNEPEVRDAFRGRKWRVQKLSVSRPLSVPISRSLGRHEDAPEEKELLIMNFNPRKEREGLAPYEGSVPKREWHKVDGEWFPK